MRVRRLSLLCLALLTAPGVVPFGFASPGQRTASGTADPTPAGFHGRVLDSSGAPIAGARIEIEAAGHPSGGTLPAVTDERGEFSLRLQPGLHTVRVTAPGFAPASQRLAVGDAADARRDFVLQVEGLRETVSVTAASGYEADTTTTATKTPTLIRDVPQAVTIVTQELIRDQLMTSMADVVSYVPGITAHQGENNRDDLVIRGNRSSADFFLNGVRDDVQYYRDLYNLDRVEALKGPNAMIFGRGGGGGVVNRVLKEAGFQPLRAATFQAGAYDNKRVTGDFGQPLTDSVALRVNGMFEDSGSFRKGVSLERAAVNPTLTIAPCTHTKVTLGYEYLRDTRVANRGITSFRGRPADVAPSAYYGDAENSHVRAGVNIGSALVEHRFARATVRNRTMIGGYNRFYQNYVPGAASPDRSLVTVTAYNNATNRTNLFNQSDLAYVTSTGPVRHTLLTGVEVGRQSTANFRQSGFFNNAATSVLVPFDQPTVTAPVVFRQNATDADNHVRATVAAAFAQDQVELSRHLQLIAGLRVDRFDLQYHNNRNGDTLSRADNLVSPRAGIVVKPVSPVSIYGSYSVSYFPSSGDQFSSLTAVTQQLEPERFTNYEVGVKWDMLPALSLTTAAYRLNRTNTRSTDANDPTRIVQTGKQRTSGYEAGITGRVTSAWRVAGGYAHQDGLVTTATAAARAGAQVGQVPHHTFSLWNHYQFHPRVAAALGVVHRSDMFAAIDNTVVLPGHTRADAAAYVTVTRALRLQANVENVLNERYFVNADSNTNISPGSPRTLRIALLARF